MKDHMEHNIIKEQRGTLHTVLDQIKRGDEVIYHIGAYASGCHKADALELYNAGKCILFQRKLGPNRFAYVARKPLKV